MSRVLRTGILTLLISVTLLGVAALGKFLYVRHANAQMRVETLQERVAQLESREACRVRTWSETIATSGSNGVLQITNGTQLQKFRIRRPGSWEPGWFSEAWVTECEPRGEILKFDEFSVMPFKEGVIVSAKPRTNEQISMRFKIIGVMR
jgi:hypothetical protein